MQYKQAKHDEKKIYKNKITKSMSCNLIMLYIVLYIRYRRRTKDLSVFSAKSETLAIHRRVSST